MDTKTAWNCYDITGFHVNCQDGVWMLRTVLLSSCLHFGCTGFLYLTEVQSFKVLSAKCKIIPTFPSFYTGIPINMPCSPNGVVVTWGVKTCNLFTQTSSCSRRNGDKSEAHKPSLTDTSTINFSLNYHNCQRYAFKFPQEISTIWVHDMSILVQYDISIPENPWDWISNYRTWQLLSKENESRFW